MRNLVKKKRFVQLGADRNRNLTWNECGPQQKNEQKMIYKKLWKKLSFDKKRQD